MRRFPEIVVILAIIIVALVAYVLYLRSRIKDLSQTAELGAMMEDSNRTAQARSSSTIGDLQQKLATCEQQRDQPPAPAGAWWCYRGHACFASADQCVKAGKEDDRAVECVSAAQAWCGGKDGHTCFAEPCECHALEGSGGVPCVLAH